MSSAEKTTRQPFWTLTRIGLIGSAILLLAAIASALYRKDAAPPPTRLEDVTNEPAAAAPNSPGRLPGGPITLPATVTQAEIELLNGKSLKLSDYLGKVVVLDLWATWCGPCRQEIPHLIQMANDYKGKGVEVIGLTNENPQTDAQLVKDFSKQFKINYQIGWADAPLAVGIMNGRNGIPQTLIIGRDGKVRKHFVGFNPMISVPQMKAAIDEAVGGE